MPDNNMLRYFINMPFQQLFKNSLFAGLVRTHAITTVPTYAALVAHCGSGMFKVQQDETNENSTEYYIKDGPIINWVPTSKR